MYRVVSRARVMLGGALLLAACSDLSPSVMDIKNPAFSEGEATSYSGRATVVKASVAGLAPVLLVDAGPLPSSGGAAEASLLEAAVPGLLSAQVLHAATIGQDNRAFSESSVANLNLTVAGNTIAASFLRSRAEAVCNDDGTATVVGSSEIVGLNINGIPVTVSGNPNQEISLLGAGTIIINEQQASQSGNSGDITVNALHVIVPGVADVVIASAHADITCRGNDPCAAAGDFLTGGGWIEAPTGGRGTFAVAGGIKNGGLWGHLNYIDHDARLKIKGITVTNYEVIDPTTRRIKGAAEINGTPDSYEVIVSDKGEPGRDDTFELRVTGYTATGNLRGGNIQLHRKTNTLPCIPE